MFHVREKNAKYVIEPIRERYLVEPLERERERGRTGIALGGGGVEIVELKPWHWHITTVLLQKGQIADIDKILTKKQPEDHKA